MELNKNQQQPESLSVTPTSQTGVSEPNSSSVLPSQTKRKSKWLFTLIIFILLAGIVGTYTWQHGEVNRLNKQVASLSQQVTSLKNEIIINNLAGYKTPNNPGSGATPTTAPRNSQRQTDILAIQTQLEAYFTQAGHYPSLTDMNSSSWLASNMKYLNQSVLVDPSNPTHSKALASSPTASQYSYQVTNSSGASCESNDTTCAKFTLTATYEGSINGATTFTRANLD